MADTRAVARPPRSARLGRIALRQGALVLLPVAGALLLLLHARSVGAGGGAAQPTAASGPDPIPKLLMVLPVILLACRACAALFARIGQPQVVGEIFAGVLLGPSLLGLVWPAGYAWLFPPYLAPALNVLAQVGLVLFMFLVGYELDVGLLRGRGEALMTVSQASMAIPFAGGVLLATAMYGALAPPGVSLLTFALFIAVSMSVTAFPVLAGLLVERGLDRTLLGAMALACAALNDVAAWCLLAVVVALATSASLGGVAVTLALLVAYVLVMFLCVRPLLARLVRSGLPQGVLLPVVLSAVLLSALATEEIGVHPIFGAFLLGVVTPRGERNVHRAMAPVRTFTTTLLLPLFFVSTGLRTRFGLLGSDPRLWGWCLLALGVAVLGKGVGSTVAARAAGVDRRHALSLGALLNCRGLTELVVLSVGLDLGVIDSTVFAMLVMMTLVSTVMTAPALSLIERTVRAPDGSAHVAA
ncbi:cation:proton antiporter [Streptomyces sp. NPDC006655]|uniref:cation:proton antiporter domain-containing protein n=1 Tax=Streptomyces sp. NPDC006655 TaxID=3156898 RepID=UPI003453EBC0